jgi:hypothetical protein
MGKKKIEKAPTRAQQRSVGAKTITLPEITPEQLDKRAHEIWLREGAHENNPLDVVLRHQREAHAALLAEMTS